jgi:hypothetical protein
VAIDRTMALREVLLLANRHGPMWRSVARRSRRESAVGGLAVFYGAVRGDWDPMGSRLLLPGDGHALAMSKWLAAGGGVGGGV